jgi:endonuclease/exonuclease/phosphatase family metal-dependent hydrolase
MLSHSTLKLGCLNIEQYKHLDVRVIPALRDADLDVICLQEVPQDKVGHLESALGATSFFLPTTIRTDPDSGIEHVFGLAILVRCATVLNCDPRVYHEASPEDIPFSADRALLVATVEKDDVSYLIGNTHLTWTYHGEATNQQLEDLDALFGVIDDHVGDEIIICGDFNAPRGRMTWEMLASRYRDNIPASVTTTLDQTLHRSAPIFYVVDGMFTSRHYVASDVELQDGVSDHMLITGNITRVA